LDEEKVVEEERLLEKAKEAAENSKIILDDMRKNRGSYSAVDLAWRNIDMNIVVVESLRMVLNVLETLENQMAKLTGVEKVEEEVEGYNDEAIEKPKSGESKPKKKTTQAKKPNVRPAISKVVDKSKK